MAKYFDAGPANCFLCHSTCGAHLEVHGRNLCLTCVGEIAAARQQPAKPTVPAFARKDK